MDFTSFLSYMILPRLKSIKSPRRGNLRGDGDSIEKSDNAQLLGVEPNVEEHNVFKLTNYKEAYEKADIVVFLVNHREFAELNYREDVKVLDFCGTFKK